MEILERQDETSQDYPRMGLNAAERTYISRQANLFHKMRSQFVPRYQGLWVLFEDGQILDSDEDPYALTERTSRKLGKRIFLIKKVK